MHNFYLSRKKRERKKRFSPRRYTIITFSRDASSFPESKYIFERILSGKFCWKRVPRELHPLFYPSDAENIWGTITKQPVKIRETPERNWGLVGRHDRKILVSRRATLLNSLSLSFFSFLCCQITGIQSFHLWQIFIRGASYPSPPLLVVTAFVSKLLNYTLPR